MSGVGAFIVGAAAGAAVGVAAAKKHQKHKDKHYYDHHHHQSSRTVVVHHPPQQVKHQTHVVYVNKPTGAKQPPQGYPHGYPQTVPYGPQQGYPTHGHPPQGYPQGHQQPHYPPQPPSTQVFHQSVPQSPGYPPAIGFVGSQGPLPPSSYPSPYPPPASYSNPPAPPQHGGYPPALQYDACPPHQATGYPPTPSGYPSNGYPPMPSSSSSQYPPPAPHPQAGPFQVPSVHPQLASAAPAQALQAQVTVHLTTTSNQQSTAGSNAAVRPDRRYFVLQNEETRYALHVDPNAGSKLVMRQRTATGSWDPQWSSGQGQALCQGQLWYLDTEGIIRSQMNDFAIEAKDGGSWLCLAPYRGDSKQLWIVRDGRILSNRTNPSDCICLEEGLMGTAVNADVIVTKYQARRHHHWVIEYV